MLYIKAKFTDVEEVLVDVGSDIYIPEESRTKESVVRKEAGKPIEIRDPVTKKYFIHVPAPTLHQPDGQNIPELWLNH